MINGFFEVGLVALVAFVIVNPLAILAFAGGEAPRPAQKLRERDFEEGVPVEGATLVTPKIKLPTRVA